MSSDAKSYLGFFRRVVFINIIVMNESVFCVIEIFQIKKTIVDCQQETENGFKHHCKLFFI